MNATLRPRWALFCAVTALYLAVSTNAHAIDPATRGAARDLAYAGVEAFDEEDYETASDKLERAYALLQAPSIALWSARALEMSGKWVEASERYLEASRLPAEAGSEKEVQLKAQEDALREREELRAKLPSIEIHVEGVDEAETRVTINGVQVAPALIGAGRPTNPGAILVLGTHGTEEVREEFTLSPGEKKVLTLSFTAPAPAPLAPAALTQEPLPQEEAEPKEAQKDAPNTQRTLGWVSVGIGGAGLIFGGVAGIIAIDQSKNLQSKCPSGVCPREEQQALQNYNTMKSMSSAGLIAGSLMAVTGVSLLVFAPKNEDSAYVGPYIGLGDLGFRGAF